MCSSTECRAVRRVDRWAVITAILLVVPTSVIAFVVAPPSGMTSFKMGLLSYSVLCLIFPFAVIPGLVIMLIPPTRQFGVALTLWGAYFGIVTFAASLVARYVSYFPHFLRCNLKSVESRSGAWICSGSPACCFQHAPTQRPTACLPLEDS